MCCTSRIFSYHNINPFGTEAGIFQENHINIMAADSLALCVTDCHGIECVLVSIEEGFQIFRLRNVEYSNDRKCKYTFIFRPNN